VGIFCRWRAGRATVRGLGETWECDAFVSGPYSPRRVDCGFRFIIRAPNATRASVPKTPRRLSRPVGERPNHHANQIRRDFGNEQKRKAMGIESFDLDMITDATE
jgi:hypothetical protein